MIIIEIYKQYNISFIIYLFCNSVSFSFGFCSCFKWYNALFDLLVNVGEPKSPIFDSTFCNFFFSVFNLFLETLNDVNL